VTTRPVVALLTDFGTSDPYVGMMKGVIAGICPDANVIDVTHEVPPQDVRIGAFFLERSYRYFPTGSVLVAVVDPGVGTSRRRIALASNGRFFVGPDNGLLSVAAARYRAFSLTRRALFLPDISNTFHGRDVFAPVAAHLARGVPLERFGPPLRRIIALRWPKPTRRGTALVGEIISVDRFGNLITNVEPSHWRSLRRPRVSAGDFESSRLATSYAEVDRGKLTLVFGGYGLLEIAARDASAANELALGVGDRVRLVGA
jgi:S-adenosyl-L-methionine hydrolase (adenosine-forming)